MIKREEVEDFLLICDQRHVLVPSRVSVDSDTLAELARTWLRVNDAPVVDVYEMNDGRIVTDAPGHLSGQRVHLVPEADSGGDRG